MCLWCTTRLLPGLCSGLYLCVFVGFSFRSVCFSFTKSAPSCVIMVITCHFSCGTCDVAQGSLLVLVPFLLKCFLWQCLHFFNSWCWWQNQGMWFSLILIHTPSFASCSWVLLFYLKYKLYQPSRRYYFMLRKQIFVCHQAVNQLTGICCFSDLANPHLLLDRGELSILHFHSFPLLGYWRTGQVWLDMSKHKSRKNGTVWKAVFI